MSNSHLSTEVKASTADTWEHIHRIQQLTNVAIKKLLDRAERHDQSKLDSPEAEIFHEHGPNLKKFHYNSPEYNEGLKQMKIALDHHYGRNRHHPQHFKNGVHDMNLFDLLEMFIDWTASSERQLDGNIRTSIEENNGRYHLDDVKLSRIFENTIEEFE